MLLASEKVDHFATSEINKDIDWINNLFETKLGIVNVRVRISEDNLNDEEKIITYGTYKRYIPIGIAGGVTIGYCLFRIVGAVIGIGGGLLAYLFLSVKDSSQIEEIRRNLNLKIKDISLSARKIFKNEIEQIYAEILSEFDNETKEILDEKYRFDYVDESHYMEQKQKLDNLIKKIEEV